MVIVRVSLATPPLSALTPHPTAVAHATRAFPSGLRERGKAGKGRLLPPNPPPPRGAPDPASERARSRRPRPSPPSPTVPCGSWGCGHHLYTCASEPVTACLSSYQFQPTPSTHPTPYPSSTMAAADVSGKTGVPEMKYEPISAPGESSAPRHPQPVGRASHHLELTHGMLTGPSFHCAPFVTARLR